MLRLYLILFAALICGGCQHRASLYQFRTEPAAVFFGHGVYPDWTLKVSRTSIYFHDELTEIQEDIDPAYFGSNHFRDSYHSEKIGFWTTGIQCFDYKSRKYLNYTITVELDGKTLRGCGGVPMTSKEDHLAGTHWRLETINGHGPIKNAMAELRFSNGRLIAFVGCNRLSRDYAVRNGDVSFGQIQTTNFECSEAEKIQERNFLEVLGREAKFEFDRFGNLIIQQPGKGRIVMRQTP